MYDDQPTLSLSPHGRRRRRSAAIKDPMNDNLSALSLDDEDDDEDREDIEDASEYRDEDIMDGT